VLTFFSLGTNGLPLQLTPTTDGCQVSLHHPCGMIVERFPNVSSALRRAEQLNELLSRRPARNRGRGRIRRAVARRPRS
jgi:hypothetical protein